MSITKQHHTDARLAAMSRFATEHGFAAIANTDSGELSVELPYTCKAGPGVEWHNVRTWGELRELLGY